MDGRFTTVDPHAIDHADVSPYSYCENNPAKLVDKDGKDPGDFFRTMDAAAIDFALNYNGISIINNVEYATSIVSVFNKDGKLGYTYLVPNEGTKDKSSSISNIGGHNISATMHTHGKYISDTDNYFSGEVYRREDGSIQMRPEKSLKHVVDSPSKRPTDIGSANKFNRILYVATPNGSLRKYTPKTSTIQKVSNNIPADPKDPHRVSFIPPSKPNKHIHELKYLINIGQLLLNRQK